MDLEKELIHAVLTGGDEAYRKATDRGVDPDVHLVGEGRAAWNYLVEYRKQYGVLPSKDFVTGVLGIDLVAQGSDPLDALLDQVMKRRLFGILTEGSKSVRERLEKLEIDGAAETWKEIHKKLATENLTTSRVESLLALGTEVLRDYEAAKSGARGIATPFQTMTEQTMGWSPEDMILFVGRLGVGKTWALMLAAHVAWKDTLPDGRSPRVLVVSTEMAKKRLAQRFFGMHLKLPYEQLRHGRLGEFVEQKMKDAITSMLKDQGIYVVGGCFDYSIESVNAAIEDAQADLVCIDGAYLIKNTGKDRHERVSNTFDDFKRIAKNRKVAILSNTQFNRNAKTAKVETLSAENVGMTDVAGWNADAVYALNQTDEMRDNCQMCWHPIKIRESKQSDFISRWDLQNMDFSEIRPGADAPPAVNDDDSSSRLVDDGPIDDDLPF